MSATFCYCPDCNNYSLPIARGNCRVCSARSPEQREMEVAAAKARLAAPRDPQPEPQPQQPVVTRVTALAHKSRLPDGSERCLKCDSGCLDAQGICEACGHNAYPS